MRLLQRLFGRVREATGTDPIKHVVVLMFENHSFDQMLGCFKSVYPDLDGVDPRQPYSNQDSAGRKYFQRQSNDTVVNPDPKHELEHILNQLRGGNAGFVSEYEKEYPATTADERQRIMDYFGKGDLPALHELAECFTICDHWYSSVPGPTWTNRFFVHSGTSKGLVTMPDGFAPARYYLSYNQDTIYDRLNERRISWRIYHGDVPQSLVLRHQQQPHNARHYFFLDRFFRDATGHERSFPQYTFIEPNYFHLPFEQQPQNDDHPPHSTVAAQELLAKVYNAIRSNAELWNSTLLIVVYDENGGFYDHIEPPAAVPPDEHHEEYTFDQLGVRVPALLVSPWVDRGVLPTEFDHTSLLKYMADKWGLRPLTQRDRRANSFAAAIRLSGPPRTDTPLSLSVPSPKLAMAAAPMTAEQPEPAMNENQKALLRFTEDIEPKPVAAAAAAAPGGFAAAVAAPTHGQLAKWRVEAFLRQQTATAEASTAVSP
ncbi:MAG TPA: alkaline phosphatase family protein [Pirellulales bacterium]|nr:alkaline phosphatase family protein [Pirellulales bacterium]